MSEPGSGADAASAPTVVLTAIGPEEAPAPDLPPAPASTPTLAAALLLFLSTLFCIPVLIYALLNQPAVAGGGTPDIDALVAASMAELTVASIFAMLATASVLWAFRGRRLADDRPPMPATSAYLLAVFAGIGIQAGCLGISMLASYLAVPVNPSNAEPITDLTQRAPWLAWIAVVLIAPLAEELLFRHVLLRRFAVAGRGLIGLVATALLFASIHELTPWVTGWLTWLVTTSLYVAMGLGFGAVYLRTRRLGAAFVAHATCNLLAMLLLAFSVS